MGKIDLLIINGPNLNMLGLREPHIYGNETLDSINSFLSKEAMKYGIELTFFQSNSEGEIITEIQKAGDKFHGIVINPGGYTHQSIPIRDSIASSPIPVVEVHISNIHAREEWRSKSVIAPVSKGQISGFGKFSYLLGILAIFYMIEEK